MNYGATSGGATLDRFVEDFNIRGALEPQLVMKRHLNILLTNFLAEARIFTRSKRVETLFTYVDSADQRGEHILAADTLLDCVVDMLEVSDFNNLTFLLETLRRELKDVKPEDQVDYKLSRVHSVLALTYRYSGQVYGRTTLRSEYHSVVASREGQRAADDAVANL